MKVIIALSCIAGLILLFIGTISYVAHTAEQQIDVLMNTSITSWDVSSLEDGTYLGEVKTIPIHVIVEVIIVDHVVTEIKIIKHQSGQGAKADEIIEYVILQQSLQVDFIAGATYSSKAILIAINQALTGDS